MNSDDRDPFLVDRDMQEFEARTQRLEKLLEFVSTHTVLPKSAAAVNPDVLRAYDEAMEAAFLAIRHSAMELVPR